MTSIRKFKDFLSERQYESVSFWSENQTWYDDDDPFTLRLTFEVAFVFEYLNVICLKSGKSTLSLDRVKSVIYDENSSILGVIATVICGDRKNDDSDIQYILIIK